MKVLAFILLAIGAVALNYGNAPVKRVRGRKSAGVRRAVCAAAEWDNEQMNFLPHYNPELNKVIAAGQAAPVTYNLYGIARVRA